MNLEWLLKLIEEDSLRVFREIKTVSYNGLNIKQNTPLFAYALLLAHEKRATIRMSILCGFQDIIRTGSQLLTFFNYYKQLTGGKGSGNGLKKAISKWYNSNQAEFQMVKYRNRSGWSHGNILKLIRPTPIDFEHKALFYWATNTDGPNLLADARVTPHIHMFEVLKTLKNNSLVHFIETTDKPIPWEFLPTEALSNEIVWKALYRKGMAYSALIRNLGNASSKGTFKNSHALVTNVAEQITNEASIRYSKIHPFNILNALFTYRSGQGFRGSLSWTPDPVILAALEEAFYTSFGNVESTGKRRMVALDVSGSMGGAKIANSNLSAREASVALAIMAAAIDPHTIFVGFSHELIRMHFNKRTSLFEAIRTVSNIPFGATDISLPMEYAEYHGLDIDSFEIYTDNETNQYGRPQPMVALNRYRSHRGINAKLITVGMVSNGFTVADPNDPDTMDVVGFDTSAVQAISAFVKGI